MRPLLPILLGVISWVALVTYIVLSTNYCSQQKEVRRCHEIRVVVQDSADYGFITPGMVKGWFEQEKIKLLNKEVSAINTLELERLVSRRGYVKRARVYTSMDGVLHVELTQRRPIIRFNTANGYNFYLTEDNYILPAQRYFVTYVPVVSGTISFPFEKGYVGSLKDFAKDNEKKNTKNYLFLSNLISFVEFVREDPFWNAFFVQIDVLWDPENQAKEPQIRLVPRVGELEIRMGGVDNYQEKLKKLLTFYRSGLTYEGWNTYRVINIAYKDQVVCSK